jgi:uncharacterized OB-fold protein
MVIEHKKSLVIPDSDSKEFWDAAGRHELFLQKCLQCGKFLYPPGPVCPDCLSLELKWEQVKGGGSVYSFTVVRIPIGSEWAQEVPYILAAIELDCGVKMVSTVINCDAKDVKIGMKVRLVFSDRVGELSVPKFEPVP